MKNERRLIGSNFWTLFHWRPDSLCLCFRGLLTQTIFFRARLRFYTYHPDVSRRNNMFFHVIITEIEPQSTIVKVDVTSPVFKNRYYLKLKSVHYTSTFGVELFDCDGDKAIGLPVKFSTTPPLEKGFIKHHTNIYTVGYYAGIPRKVYDPIRKDVIHLMLYLCFEFL